MISNSAATMLASSFAFLTTGCATMEPEGGPQEESIAFESGACFGFCPVFSFTVSPDGRGVYQGTDHVGAGGHHSFTITPEQYQAFRARLAPFRPEDSVSYDHEHCDGPVATDAPSVKIAWGQRPVTLDWYMGCRQPGLQENAETISRAWTEIPAVVALVGDDQHRAANDGS